MAKTQSITPAKSISAKTVQAYRTPSFFKGKSFGGKQAISRAFNPSTFKTQHKG